LFVPIYSVTDSLTRKMQFSSL